MPLDRAAFADKLTRYCSQFQVSTTELARGTGIYRSRLDGMLNQCIEPTGDEILILSDYFKCDYRFWVSNERLAPFEQTETLFRRLGDTLSQQDKWAIQELLFLCECEEFLISNSPGIHRVPFAFTPEGNYFKKHGRDAAAALRRHLGYREDEVRLDIYSDLRQMGVHVFRRKLGKSVVSGLCIKHPTAGPCLLVNYDEDVFRQRFSAAHEAAHSILDAGDEVIISYSKWDQGDLSEIRAQTFASSYLVPEALLRRIPQPTTWSPAKIIEWSIKLRVNTEVLARALSEYGLVSRAEREVLSKSRVPKAAKDDPELPTSLAPNTRARREMLLERGLSNFYVGLCFDAYDRGTITASRLAEMLLSTEEEMHEIAGIWGRRVGFGG